MVQKLDSCFGMEESHSRKLNPTVMLCFNLKRGQLTEKHVKPYCGTLVQTKMC